MFTELSKFYLEHKYKENSDKLFCDLCDAYFDTHSKLNLHRRRRHVLEIPNESEENDEDAAVDLCCSFCNRICFSHAELSLHTRRKHELESEDEDENFKENVSKSAVDGTLCNKCGRTFRSISKYNFHYKMKHSGKTLTEDIHFISDRLSVSSPIKETRTNASERSKTEICEVTSSQDIEIISNHATTCSHCGKDFTSVSKLNFHQKRKHSEPPDTDENLFLFSCRRCKITFRSADILKGHYRDVHNKLLGENVEIDEIEHISRVIHHDEIGTNAKSPLEGKYRITDSKTGLCNQQNGRNDRLSRDFKENGKSKGGTVHIETLHEEFLKADKSKEILTSAEVNSSTTNVFCCLICGQLLQSTTKLNFHYKLKHANKTPSNNVNTSLTLEMAVATTHVIAQECEVTSTQHLTQMKEYSHSCLDCGKKFLSVSKLNFHRRLKHQENYDGNSSNIKQNLDLFCCYICKQTFSFSNKLMLHYREAHNQQVFDISEDENSLSKNNIMKETMKDNIRLDSSYVADVELELVAKLDIGNQTSVPKRKELIQVGDETPNSKIGVETVTEVSRVINETSESKITNTEVSLTHPIKRARVQSSAEEWFSVLRLPGDSPASDKSEPDACFACRTCILKFSSPYELAVHQLAHTSLQSFCPEVNNNPNEALKEDIGLGEFQRSGIDDLKLKPTIKERHACSVCRKILKSSYALKLHSIIHTKFSCEFCRMEFKRKNKLIIHERLHAESSKDQSEFTRHFRRSSVRPLVCHLCMKIFSHSKRVVSHLKFYHEVDTTDAVCLYCNKTYATYGRLVVHYSREHFHAGGWNRSTSSTDTVLCHSPAGQKIESRTVNDSNLTKQKLIFNETADEASELSISCAKDSQEGGRHSFGLSNASNSSSKQPVQSNCKQTESISSEDEFNEMKNTTNQKNANEVIKSAFTTNHKAVSTSVLAEAVEDGQQDEKQRCVCAVCNKVFTSSYSLQYHSLIHTDESKIFPCGACNKAFRRIGDLKRHSVVHLKKSNKKITTKPQLKTIELSHRNAGDGFICKLCDKSFSLMENLNRHTKMAHKITSIVCNICSVAFSGRRGFVQHMKRVHNNIKSPACEKAGPTYEDSGKIENTGIVKKPSSTTTISEQLTTLTKNKELEESTKNEFGFRRKQTSILKPFALIVVKKPSLTTTISEQLTRLTKNKELEESTKNEFGFRRKQTSILKPFAPIEQSSSYFNSSRKMENEAIHQDITLIQNDSFLAECHLCKKKFSSYGALFTHYRMLHLMHNLVNVPTVTEKELLN